MKKINIVLVQIANRNLGDTVIFDTVKFLILKALPFIFRKKYNVISYNIYTNNLELLRNADAIIFAGGGIIKYKYERFHEYIPQIIDVAEEENIPVFFNSVGIEGFDAMNKNACRLQEALNKNCVKVITVRDDVKTLKEQYIQNSNILIKSVTDPAVWTYKAYGIQKEVNSQVVGIGIVRYKIFEDNGIEYIDHKYQLEFWKQVFNRLNDEGISWKVFTNGLKSDEDFAEEVLNYAGYDTSEQYKVKRLTQGVELVEVISKFKGIIACRMHANIVAYSLQIPSVAIVWNDKLKFWGEKIGHSERFILADNMKAEVIVSTLLSAMKEEQRGPSLKMRYSSLLTLEYFIQKYAKKRKHKNTESINWSNHLVAVALGGMNHIYCNMNILEAFDYSYNNGFKWFESDVRLTSDNELVCVNGWNEPIYKKLELKENSEHCKEMSCKEFLEMKYYGHYETICFETLIDKLAKFKKINLIVDIGKPQKEKMDLFYDKVVSIVPVDLYPNIIMRLQRKADVILIRRKIPAVKIAFYLEAKLEDDKLIEFIEFCLQYNIDLVTMKMDVFQDSLVNTLHRYNIKVCLFTTDNFKEVNKLVENGADLIGTHYLKVNDLNALDIQKTK